MKNQIQDAFRFAQEHHEGQVDKAGQPYFGHIRRVFEAVGGFDADPPEVAVVALLHDIVEDTAVGLNEIEERYGQLIREAVAALTKDDRPYEVYLEQVKRHPWARRVKIADLTDNSHLGRIPQPSDKDRARVKKYQRGLEYLSASDDSAGNISTK